MGIKFQCPNGHSLNVKTFLAGKRGICPHCDSRFIIPHKSGGQAAPAPSRKQSEQASGSFAPQSSSTPSTGTQPETSSPTLANTAQPRAENRALADASFQPTRGPIQYGFPANLPVGTLQPALPVGTQLSDPIDEAPQAVWYVRPPSGGQFGPAVGEVMRNWIAEGRVSGDSWVWREGWSDWRQAGTVLPQLVPGAATIASAPSDRGVEFSPGPSLSETESPAAQVRVRSRRIANQLTLTLVGLLILVAIGLVGVFVWVLGQQKEAPAARSETSPAIAVATFSADSSIAPISAARVASSRG